MWSFLSSRDRFTRNVTTSIKVLSSAHSLPSRSAVYIPPPPKKTLNFLLYVSDFFIIQAMVLDELHEWICVRLDTEKLHKYHFIKLNNKIKKENGSQERVLTVK